MRRLPVLLALVCALAIPVVGAHAAPSPSAHAAKQKNCKTPFTESRPARYIRATNVSCDTARAVSERVSAGVPTGCVKFTDKQGHVKLVTPCKRMGYRCTARSIVNRLAIDATCKSGAKVVKFQY